MEAQAQRGDSSAARMVVVSNRLPVVVEQQPDGRPRLMPGSGGLVSALAPVLRDRGGVWIGWPGSTVEQGLDEMLADAEEHAGYRLVAQPLTSEEVELYYYGFANQVLWPVLHDLPGTASYEPRFWRAYESVNRSFARTIADTTAAEDFVWVHDYHLMGVAHALRELGVERSLAYFLHTPFPPLDIFLRLPRRLEILKGLLEYDLIGVQTMRDRRNLVACLRTLVRNVKISREGALSVVELPDGRRLQIGSFPISIDYREFARGATEPDVVEAASKLASQFPADNLVLGVDRLDYTKGIPQRLNAFEHLLEHHPELRRQVTLIQVVVPSRRQLPSYDELKQRIDRRIGDINGRFSEPGWTPIHYLYGSLPRRDLLAYYAACQVALVTPIKDGMNLIVKEFCAASPDRLGVPVLSEFTGAASQMHRHALMVNPNDVEGTAEAIRQAVTMPLEERQQRTERLRKGVRRQDIFWWVDGFLQAAAGRRLDDFPVIQRYVEQLEVKA